jgi:RNA polymerase sigma-70 factor (ECF subfamily)
MNQTAPLSTDFPPSIDAAAEATLVSGLLLDDARAWREFNQRYARLLFRCITRVTARFPSLVGPEDVREIYAYFCLQLLAHNKRKLRSFDPERGNRLGTWLGLLATHAAWDHLRSLRREPAREALNAAEELCSADLDPHESASINERARIASELLERFSEKDREFLVLYFGEGLAPERIAEQMQISVKTVYSKKHKITARLESLLGRKQLAA